MSEVTLKTHEIPLGPARVVAEVKDLIKGYKMTPGDYGSLTQLFFDNLSTMLGALFAVQAMEGFGAPKDDLDNVIWGRIVPGVGITLFTGNVYYTWMGIRLTNKWGRPYTAQPYGLNTPQAFAFVYNVMYPVYFNQKNTMGNSDAFWYAYKTALAVNFITGLISTVLAFFGPLILKYVPPGALLVPIAGLGIAFLGLEQATASIAAPIVGYYAIMFMFLGWYSNVRVPLGFCRMPEALQVILVGAILGWATGYNKGSTVQDAAKLVKWWGPSWALQDLIDGFDFVQDYLGIVIPIAISATATTLMCLVSAQQAGDPYPVRESMLVDGIGTMASSVFGSPFGTVIYIGHPAHKRSGALVGYSITNGCIYLILSWFGVLALVQSIVNPATIGPIVLFICLMVNEEALAFMPARHRGAYVIGLFPSIYDWTVNVASRSPLRDLDTLGNINDVGSDSWYGVLAWKRGSLLVSFVWVGMLVMVIDRRWPSATVWAMIAAFFACVGIIHVPVAGFKNFTSPTWEQCSAYPDACWQFGEQWMYFVAYVMLAATFVLIELSRVFHFDPHLLPPIHDVGQDVFKDWFANADKITVPKSKHVDDIVGEGMPPEDLHPDTSKKTVKLAADESFEDDVAKPVVDEIDC